MYLYRGHSVPQHVWLLTLLSHTEMSLQGRDLWKSHYWPLFVPLLSKDTEEDLNRKMLVVMVVTQEAQIPVFSHQSVN